MPLVETSQNRLIKTVSVVEDGTKYKIEVLTQAGVEAVAARMREIQQQTLRPS